MVVLLVLAVIIIVTALNIVAVGIYVYGIGGILYNAGTGSPAAQMDSIPPELMFAVTGIALLVIAGGSIFRIRQLSDGGEAVARMVGARKVSRDSKNFKEKQYINIVDELSIASGVVVPQAYVMDDEAAINAFAAGYKPNAAVIAVTHGALEQLNRDELQGVIAHEFSHILNGDMRINIRLIGILYGILVIGMFGGYMLRNVAYTRYRFRTSKQGGGAYLVLGLALLLIGYAGSFFGRIIKASISRQREFLADASAVQFTRNNEGITNALRKIGKLGDGAMIDNLHAEELSHMFFGESFKSSLAGWMATHPPLMDRIKKLNKGRVPLSSPSRREKIQTASATGQAGSTPSGGPGIISTIGNPGELHMHYAAVLLASIPTPVSQALALRQGANALMFALVLDADPKVRALELAALRRSPHQELESEVLRLSGHLDKLHDRYRLPLFDMAIPVLKDLSAEERELLIKTVKDVIDADKKIKLGELTIYVLIKAHLSASSGKADKVKYKALYTLVDEVSLLLSLLAFLGKTDMHSPADVFKAATDEIGQQLPGLKLKDPRTFKPEEIVTALEKFANLSPVLKTKLVAACIEAVLFDDKATTRELEMMRSVCAAMEVPVPPVLSGGEGEAGQD